MSEFKLMPCPFCGNNDPVLITRHGKDGFRDRYTVLCDYEHGGCGAEGSWYHYDFEAVEMWNRRADSTDIHYHLGDAEKEAEK